MNKNTCVIYAPVQTYSGYGARSRDIIKSLIELKKEQWDIKIVACRWGNTPMSYLEDHPEWKWLEDYIEYNPISYQPDYMFWITIPSEAQKVGKWNCLITAGIETDRCDPSWVEGCNRMDLVLVPSNHSKQVFIESGPITTNIQVLFEGVNLDVYTPLKVSNTEVTQVLDSIPEEFCFLFLGHWIKGDIGHDRKNVGLLIQLFLEMYKNHPSPPALVLKTSIASSCYISRNEILRRINQIKNSIKASTYPNIYLLHGDISEGEINELYNHPKIKAMISLTKGEGFGRPLLEFSTTGKPIIASNWSGHIDFLDKNSNILVNGELEPIHYSAVSPKILIEGSKWFKPFINEASNSIHSCFINYKKILKQSKNQRIITRDKFSTEDMKNKFNVILNENLPQFPTLIKLQLPKLTQV